jgi:hypothetical protein
LQNQSTIVADEYGMETRSQRMEIGMIYLLLRIAVEQRMPRGGFEYPGRAGRKLELTSLVDFRLGVR